MPSFPRRDRAIGTATTGGESGKAEPPSPSFTLSQATPGNQAGVATLFSTARSRPEGKPWTRGGLFSRDTASLATADALSSTQRWQERPGIADEARVWPQKAGFTNANLRRPAIVGATAATTGGEQPRQPAPLGARTGGAF